MPGCGCAAPPATSRPMNIPQSRGYIPGASGGKISNSFSTPGNFGGENATSSFSTSGNFGGDNKIKGSYSTPNANTDAIDAFNAPQDSMNRSSQKYQPGWKSPLKTFDNFATKVMRQKADAEEDFPKLTMPTFRGLHKCKVSALNYHQVDMAMELEQELRNIGIQGTMMMEHLEKLLKAEAACQFQGAVRAAELAAMAAPNGLAEEAAVAASRGYSVDAQQFSRMATGENPIEIVGYIGCTRPDNF